MSRVLWNLKGDPPSDKVLEYLIFANGTKICNHLNQFLGPCTGWGGRE